MANQEHDISNLDTFFHDFFPNDSVTQSNLMRSSVVGIISFLGIKIYQLVTSKQSFSELDRQRYQKMVLAYRELIPNERLCEHDQIPNCWKIDADFAPLHESKLFTQPTEFHEFIQRLSIVKFDFKVMAKRIIDRVDILFKFLHEKHSGLFNTIADKAKNQFTGNLPFRSDGIEVMFYTELVLWMTSVFPFYKANSPSTLESLNSRIKYFQTIRNKILDPAQDNPKLNAAVLLNDIIQQLQQLAQEVENYIHNTNFLDKASDVSSDIKVLIETGLDTVFSLIKDNPYSRMDVDFMLGKSSMEDKTHKKIAQTSIGKMLKDFISFAKINSNYEFTRALLPEHIFQHEFSIELENSGLFDFVFQSDDAQQRATLLLNKIHSILQLITLMGYTRNLLKKTEEVYRNYGELDLYKDGRENRFSLLLLEIVKDSVNKFILELQEFWKCYYTETYEKVTPEEQKSFRFPIFNKFIEINTTIEELVKIHKKIQEKIEDIRRHLETTKKVTAQLEQTKRELFEMTINYFKAQAARLSDEQIIAFNHFEEIFGQQMKDVHPASPAASAENVLRANALLKLAKLDADTFTFSYAPFNFSQQIASILSAKYTKINYDLDLFDEPGSFYHKDHELIYKNFLQKYQSFVQWPSGAAFLGIFIGKPGYGEDSHEQLKDYFTKLNKALKFFYKPNIFLGYEFENDAASKIRLKEKTFYVHCTAGTVFYKILTADGKAREERIPLKNVIPNNDSKQTLSFETLLPYLESIVYDAVKKGIIEFDARQHVKFDKVEMVAYLGHFWEYAKIVYDLDKDFAVSKLRTFYNKMMTDFFNTSNESDLVRKNCSVIDYPLDTAKNLITFPKNSNPLPKLNQLRRLWALEASCYELGTGIQKNEITQLNQRIDEIEASKNLLIAAEKKKNLDLLISRKIMDLRNSFLTQALALTLNRVTTIKTVASKMPQTDDSRLILALIDNLTASVGAMYSKSEHSLLSKQISWMEQGAQETELNSVNNSSINPTNTEEIKEKDKLDDWVLDVDVQTALSNIHDMTFCLELERHDTHNQNKQLKQKTNSLLTANENPDEDEKEPHPSHVGYIAPNEIKETITTSLALRKGG